MKWLGGQLKKLLGEAGITQQGLADSLGVSRQTVVDWIKGQVPKGTHLLGIIDTLQVDVDLLFEEGPSPVQVAPLHRIRRNAKVTPEMKTSAEEVALIYAPLMADAHLPPLQIVMRDSDSVAPEVLAERLRELGGLGNSDTPVDYSHVFKILENLGTCVIFREFPEDLKGYAFYTVVNGQRLVVVNTTTSVLDLIFPLLHETVHAVRNRIPKGDYIKAEEQFCDRVASLVQFPDSYVDDAYAVIEGRPPGTQVAKLKELGRRHHHVVNGLVRRIQERHGKLDLPNRSVYGADSNLRKEFRTLGDVLFSDGTGAFVELLRSLSPIWTGVLSRKADAMTTSRLAEVLGLPYLDAREVRDELLERREAVAGGRSL
jgi:transcriptional regulator with XRE-family HTH domain